MPKNYVIPQLSKREACRVQQDPSARTKDLLFSAHYDEIQQLSTSVAFSMVNRVNLCRATSYEEHTFNSLLFPPLQFITTPSRSSKSRVSPSGRRISPGMARRKTPKPHGFITPSSGRKVQWVLIFLCFF